MKREYDYTVFIGRFQPFHAGHLEVVKKALKKSDNLIMVIGSAMSPPSPRNPLTVQERIELIRAATKEFEGRIHFAPIEDYTYNLQRWIGSVQGAVHSITMKQWRAGPTKIALIGHNKDHTSYYLSLFPTWGSIPVEAHTKDDVILGATEVREIMYEGSLDDEMEEAIHVIRNRGFSCGSDYDDTLIKLFSTDKTKSMALEWVDNITYKERWGKGPFTTVDACVVQSGYILMIKRGEGQGKGLWALPGGFIDINETLEDAMIRELKEETVLKVPEKVLRGSIIKKQIYDDPHRSERARIITTAYLIELRSGPLPKVKGSDDAAEARWFPISQVLTMREQIFEDHLSIITDMLGV